MPIQYSLFCIHRQRIFSFKPLKYLNNLINKSLTPLVSEICAECITTANIKPSVSTAICCFIPLIFFPPSYPFCPLFKQSLQFYYLLLLFLAFLSYPQIPSLLFSVHHESHPIYPIFSTFYSSDKLLTRVDTLLAAFSIGTLFFEHIECRRLYFFCCIFAAYNDLCI